MARSCNLVELSKNLLQVILWYAHAMVRVLIFISSPMRSAVTAIAVPGSEYLIALESRFHCRSLKNMEDFKDIPVVLYWAGNITNLSIRESQADDFLTKPFDILNLVRKITRLAVPGAAG